MEKKLNHGQHVRKVQHFKKKSRHMKAAISDHVAHQFLHSDMVQFVEDRTLPMSSPSFMKKKCYPLHTESNTDPTVFLSDYSLFSTKTFKEMLLTIATVSDMDKNTLNKLLDIDEIFIFIRELTQLINKLNYFKLQVEQWTYYYTLGMTESIWTGRISKNMALVNSMCYTYGRSKILIEQRHKIYQEKLEKIQIDIDGHMKQISSFIDSNRLMTIITDLVYKDQYELRMEFERRRGILKFNAKDHQLVHTFYNLKPRQTEVCKYN